MAPLLPGANRQSLAQAAEIVSSESESEEGFLSFLIQHGLASMWDKILETAPEELPLTQQFKDKLHQTRLHTTGLYLSQRHRLEVLKATLDECEIPHVVYKGADARERFYEEPALRPAADIDVLVAMEHRLQAIKALRSNGFELYTKLENISHELNLQEGMASIDLHWDILRPGRTEVPMVDTLLANREDLGSHWAMSTEANLFVMLVHPVFVRYSTTPQASLMRMIDLAHALDREDADWREVTDLLETAGLKTASWITLAWLQLLGGTLPSPVPIQDLQPGGLRRYYLEQWLQRDLATRLMHRPALVQAGFTLPAHDRLSGAVRALRLKKEKERTAESDLQAVLHATAG